MLFLNQEVDMTKSFELAGNFSFKAISGNNPFAAGDTLGFVFFTGSSFNDFRKPN